MGEWKDTAAKAAQIASESELFRAASYAALKARAGRMARGDIVRIGEHEFTVDEDELEETMVVVMILPRRSLEDLAASEAVHLGLELESMSRPEQIGWMEAFFGHLQEILRKWHQVRLLKGPGENVTLEKAAYRKGRGL
jgi:hypothetical protein